MSKKWDITLWAEAEHVSDHEYDGEYDGARARADEIVESYRHEGWTRPLDFDIKPHGLLHESLPRGWGVDEVRGELVRFGPHSDPLPHVGLRVWENGNVSAILERGLQRSRPVVAVIARVVPAHLGSLKKVSPESVDACRRALEVELGRLAARRHVTATPEEGPVGRTWA